MTDHFFLQLPKSNGAFADKSGRDSLITTKSHRTNNNQLRLCRNGCMFVATCKYLTFFTHARQLNTSMRKGDGNRVNKWAHKPLVQTHSIPIATKVIQGNRNVISHMISLYIQCASSKELWHFNASAEIFMSDCCHSFTLTHCRQMNDLICFFFDSLHHTINKTYSVWSS